MRRSLPFERGVEASAATNSILIVWVYAVAFPTRDMRARIPFLLGMSGPVEALMAVGVTVAVGLLGLAIVGDWQRQSVLGVVIGALLSLLILASGESLIPSGYEHGPRYGWFAAAVVAALLLLWHARRRVARSAAPPNGGL